MSIFDIKFSVDHQLHFDGGYYCWEDYIRYCPYYREFEVMKSQEPYKVVNGEVSELELFDKIRFDELFDEYTRSGRIDDVIQAAFKREYY